MTANRSSSVRPASSLAQEAARRSLSRRQGAAETEVRNLIEAGRGLLSSEHNARVADIVRSAGASNDAFYRYFRSKEDFVAAVVEDGGNRLVSYISRKMDACDSVEEKIRAAVEAVLSQAGNPAVARATRNILAHATGPQRDSGVRTRLETSLAALLSDTVAAAGATDPDRDARAATGVLLGVMEHFLWTETGPSEQDVAHLSTFILRAIQ